MVSPLAAPQTRHNLLELVKKRPDLALKEGKDGEKSVTKARSIPSL